LHLPNLIEGTPLKTNEVQGLAGIYLFSIFLAVAPFGFKLEVGNDYVKTYFLGFRLRTIQSSKVQAVVYGNLFRGGLGYGNGLTGWELVHPERKLFRSKYFSIGGEAYGKDAIAHAKRVLESQMPTVSNCRMIQECLGVGTNLRFRDG
jgi:hypothetical protein